MSSPQAPQPSILVVGSTGNTGRNVVRTLANLLPNSSQLSRYRILAQTRNANSDSAKALSTITNVTIVEELWPAISAQWLKSHNVRRVFVACHNEPVGFADETAFLLAARDAGVEYAVRISTTAVNVRADSPAYYTRQHWAVEQFLEAIAPASNPNAMKWTSLQPMGFTDLVLGPAVAFVKEFRKSHEQTTLRLMVDEHVPSAPIDCNEVGAFAAHLLVQEDLRKFHTRRYIMNGPVDITGRQIVEMVEDAVGEKVEDIRYRDLSFLDSWAEHDKAKAHHILSIKHGIATSWAGLTRAEHSSPEVAEILQLKNTPAVIFGEMLRSEV